MIIYDDNAYYAYHSIRQQRSAMQHRYPDSRLLSDKTGSLLFRLVNHLSSTRGEPLTIVEIGPLPDISTAYLSAPTERNTVLSYDSIPRTLPKRIDMAFIRVSDSTTMTTALKALLPALQQHSIVVMDDIHRRPETELAWHAIQAIDKVTSSLDLYDVGVLLFNRHYIRKHYKLRF